MQTRISNDPERVGRNDTSGTLGRATQGTCQAFDEAGELHEATLGHTVVGQRLAGPTLGDALGDGPTLLVFLRHFG